MTSLARDERPVLACPTCGHDVVTRPDGRCAWCEKRLWRPLTWWRQHQ